MGVACAAVCVHAQIRYNQVGCYPGQEKMIVVEGTNPSGKVRVTTPDGKVVMFNHDAETDTWTMTRNGVTMPVDLAMVKE